MDNTLVARFWAKVEKRGPDECWPWTGAIKDNGYGVIQRGPRGGGLVRVHRLSYMIHYGEIPDGLLVLHSCNNKPCCNPRHLSAGTHSDNIEQAWADGLRLPPTNHIGERSRKLTEEDVRAIRERRARGELLRTIAADYPVGLPHISSIATRRSWSHVP